MNRGIYMASGLVAVLSVLALTPAGASFLPAGQADSHMFYGMATLVHMNGDDEIVSSKTIHNRLLDTGEDILIKGVFGGHATNEAPRLICITDSVSMPITFNASAPAEEVLEAADFVPSPGFASTGDNTCIVADIDITTDTSIATLTATFMGADSATSHIAANQAVTHLVICNQVTDAADLTNCATAGEAFVVTDAGSTMLAAADQVRVSYSLDFTSDNS